MTADVQCAIIIVIVLGGAIVKKTISIFMALIMLLSAFSANGITAFSANKQFAADKLEYIQTTKGYVPKKTAAVTGNCYGFIASVCEKLYGVTYNGEGLYSSYQCRHDTGNYYTVDTFTTKNTSPSSTDVESIISFFTNNALTGDIVHYGSLTNSGSTHTFMVQSVDSEKMVIYHSNYASHGNTSDTCHFDTIYWQSFRQSPTVSTTVSNGDYSLNAIFSSKMKNGGLGISINRYSKYSDLFYMSSSFVPEIRLARSGTKSITVAWTKLPDATKYQVQYKDKNDSSYTTATNSCTGSSYNITGLKTGSSYGFRVRAYVGGKWMSYCDPQSKAPLPPAPTSAATSLSQSGIVVSWNVRDDITGVKIYKSTDGGSFALLKNIKSNTVSSYTDKAVEAGKSYCYRVYRYYTDETATEYKSAKAELNASYTLSAPSVNSCRLSNTSLRYTFSGDGLQTAFVYSVTDSSGNVIVPQTETTESVAVVEGLTLGEYYTVSVAEKNSIAASEYTLHTKQAMPPSSSKISAAVNSDGINISYLPSQVVSGYYIYRSTEKNSGFEEIARVEDSAAADYTDKTVKYGVTYYYKVKRYTTSNGEDYLSAYSPVSTGVKNTVKKPSVTVSNKTPTSVTVKWGEVKNATKYVVQYKAENGSWKTYATVSGTSKVVSSLTTGKNYYFRVKAINNVGSGYYSSAVKIKARPAKMSPPVLKNKSNGVSVSWQKQASAGGYRIYRATSKSGSYTLVKEVQNGSTTSWKDTGVKKGKGYYYKTVCVVKKNGKKYYSQSSNYTYIKFN